MHLFWQKFFLKELVLNVFYSIVANCYMGTFIEGTVVFEGKCPALLFIEFSQYKMS